MAVRDQDRNKQGKDFCYAMFTFFSFFFDLFVWFEKIEPESLQIFNHILIVTFFRMVSQIFLSLQAFFFIIFFNTAFFHFLVLGVCGVQQIIGTVNFTWYIMIAGYVT